MITNFHSNPLVSIIIVTFNRKKYLSLAIESALAQTYSNTEVIIIDNGSTDNTENLMKAYQGKLNYFKINRSILPKGRNVGLSKAKGEFIAFLDDDDLWVKEKIAKEVEYLQAHPDKAFVFSGVRFIGPQGEDMGEMGFDEDQKLDFETMYAVNRIVSPSAVMIRKQCLDDVGFLDETLVQSSDYDLWLRLSRKYRYGYINEWLTSYRKHFDGLSRNLDRRALMHAKIFKKKGIRDGKSWWQIQVRIAQSYYNIAHQYFREGQLGKASGALARSLWICPVIGMYYWPKEAKKFRFSFLYRIGKVYGQVIVWAWRSCFKNRAEI